MLKSQSIFRRIIAALSFFTRLPFWRCCDVDVEDYKRVIPLWPLAGWLTGGVMALTFIVASYFLPINIAIIVSLISRVLLTGALHEDGFADFCDGFGGGNSRERVLEIMKDSHIGTYGVIGLVMYYVLLYNVLIFIIGGINGSLIIGGVIMIAVDSISKYLSTFMVYSLPYARKESEAKTKLVYYNATALEKFISFGIVLIPIAALLFFVNIKSLLLCIITGILTVIALTIYMKKRINGYTGDCCGATFIITEMVIYLTLLII